MNVQGLIAECKRLNPSFEHIVENLADGGILITSRATVRGQARELSLDVPAHMLGRREALETYHLEQCLRALRSPASLVAHVPGAPPAEECGERVA